MIMPHYGYSHGVSLDARPKRKRSEKYMAYLEREQKVIDECLDCEEQDCKGYCKKFSKNGGYKYDDV